MSARVALLPLVVALILLAIVCSTEGSRVEIASRFRHAARARAKTQIITVAPNKDYTLNIARFKYSASSATVTEGDAAECDTFYASRKFLVPTALTYRQSANPVPNPAKMPLAVVSSNRATYIKKMLTESTQPDPVLFYDPRRGHGRTVYIFVRDNEFKPYYDALFGIRGIVIVGCEATKAEDNTHFDKDQMFGFGFNRLCAQVYMKDFIKPTLYWMLDDNVAHITGLPTGQVGAVPTENRVTTFITKTDDLLTATEALIPGDAKMVGFTTKNDVYDGVTKIQDIDNSVVNTVPAEFLWHTDYHAAQATYNAKKLLKANFNAANLLKQQWQEGGKKGKRPDVPQDPGNVEKFNPFIPLTSAAKAMFLAQVFIFNTANIGTTMFNPMFVESTEDWSYGKAIPRANQHYFQYSNIVKVLVPKDDHDVKDGSGGQSYRKYDRLNAAAASTAAGKVSWVARPGDQHPVLVGADQSVHDFVTAHRWVLGPKIDGLGGADTVDPLVKGHESFSKTEGKVTEGILAGCVDKHPGTVVKYFTSAATSTANLYTAL